MLGVKNTGKNYLNKNLEMGRVEVKKLSRREEEKRVNNIILFR